MKGLLSHRERCGLCLRVRGPRTNGWGRPAAHLLCPSCYGELAVAFCAEERAAALSAERLAAEATARLERAEEFASEHEARYVDEHRARLRLEHEANAGWAEVDRLRAELRATPKRVAACVRKALAERVARYDVGPSLRESVLEIVEDVLSRLGA